MVPSEVTMKKTDCYQWVYSAYFSQRVYVGYSEPHGKWTAGFCDGYIRMAASTYSELIQKLGETK